jgi:hypothetical protein
VQDRRQGADRVGHVIRAVGEGHGTGGEDLEQDEGPLGVAEAIGVLLAAGLHAAEQQPSQCGSHEPERDRERKRLRQVEVELQVLQALEEGDETDHDGHDEVEEGPEAPDLRDRVLPVQNQPARQVEDEVREHSADHRRGDPGQRDLRDLAPLHRTEPHARDPEADDGAHDRVGRRDGRSEAGRAKQQGRRCGQRPQHAEGQHLQVRCHDVGHEDSLANGVGDVPPDEEGAAELQYASHDHRAADREGAGAHTRAHGVGDVVGPDRPGHEEREGASEPDQCRHAQEPGFQNVTPASRSGRNVTKH